VLETILTSLIPCFFLQKLSHFANFETAKLVPGNLILTGANFALETHFGDTQAPKSWVSSHWSAELLAPVGAYLPNGYAMLLRKSAHTLLLFR